MARAAIAMVRVGSGSLLTYQVEDLEIVDGRVWHATAARERTRTVGGFRYSEPADFSWAAERVEQVRWQRDQDAAQ